MALQPWRTGTIIKVINETADTRRYWIQIPEVDVFDFIPGQFVTLDLPIHEKVNRRWRSYSIASNPDGTNIIELVIVLNKEGAGTPYLFNQTNVGHQLTLRGPQGVYTLPTTIENDLYLICTGTGIAPFRSMVQHINKHKIPHKNIYIIFGCRTKADLLYYDEMMALQNELAGFYYLPTLSRENWEGKTGYVHEVYESLCANRQAANFYLCGWKGMIDDAKNKIAALGYDRKAIHVEIYG
jgi:ferredoxin-NADP reductase